MRQVKNCKTGHFVRYEGVLCQVNCFFTDRRKGTKTATLVQVAESGRSKRLYTLDSTEKVEYVGPVAREDGKTWISIRRDPFGNIIDDAREKRKRTNR